MPNQSESYGGVMQSSFVQKMRDALVLRHPLFVYCFGICSALAVTTSVVNALGLGLSMTVVLVLSYLAVLLSFRFLPEKFRAAAILVLVAGITIVVELLLRAWFPALSASLGIYVPLMAVSCMQWIIQQTSENPVSPLFHVVDGVLCGVGYTVTIGIVAFVRELFGSGMLFVGADGTGGVRVLGDWYSPATILLTPAGAFLLLGVFWAVYRKIRARFFPDANLAGEESKS